MKPMVEGYLLGVIATASLVAALYFLKFWRKSRDPFFGAFAASFFIESVNRTAMLLFDKPNEASQWTYLVRLLSLLLILWAILRKNLSRS